MGMGKMGFGPCRFGLGQILHPASDMNDVRFVESAVKHLTERRQRCSDKGGGWLGGWWRSGWKTGLQKWVAIDEVLGGQRE